MYMSTGMVDRAYICCDRYIGFDVVHSALDNLRR